MALTKEQIEGFKEKLLEEKTATENNLKAAKVTVDFGNDVDNFDEEGDEAEEFSNQLALKKVWEEKLEDIQNALAKFKTGKFGHCEKCGQAIELKVLEAEPDSRFCKAHKKQ